MPDQFNSNFFLIINDQLRYCTFVFLLSGLKCGAFQVIAILNFCYFAQNCPQVQTLLFFLFFLNDLNSSLGIIVIAKLVKLVFV